jgi:hypothetical protein
MFYRCQRFNSKPIQRLKRVQEERSKGNRSAPWCGAPDCPVCYWTVSGAPPDSVWSTREDRPQTLQLRVSQAQLRYNSPDCPVCHRTVRCTSGATAICAQQSTLQSEQCNSDVRAEGQRGTGLSGVAPDCLVPHDDKASKGRLAPSPNGRMTWRRTGRCPVAHRTIRCAHRQHPSPTATIWLVAINTTPTGHFKVWEPKQYSKSYS